jgi:hypothetical protein
MPHDAAMHKTARQIEETILESAKNRRPLRIAVAGAGAIGRRHIELVRAGRDCELAAIVDPAAVGAALARDAGVAHYATLQIEGGVIFGLTAALWGEITLDRGPVQQTNFGGYRMMRINEAPAIDVHIVASHDDRGGTGEPGTAGIAPALANAVFAATGKRIRKLPIGEQLKKASGETGAGPVS